MSASFRFKKEKEKEKGKHFQSMLDRLNSSGFKPITTNLGDLAHDEEKQRRYIKERISRMYSLRTNEIFQYINLNIVAD